MATAPAAAYGAALNLHRSPPLSPFNVAARSVKITRGNRRNLVVSASPDNRADMAENALGILSGEWPENFSLLSYEDLRSFLVPQICKDQMCSTARLGNVMETDVPLATMDQGMDQIKTLLESVPAVPVVDDDCRCVGIITRADLARLGDVSNNSKAGEVMSHPAITLTAENTVMEAAALMLKMKVHKIPILNSNQQVVGIVTRPDIFMRLEPEDVCINL